MSRSANQSIRSTASHHLADIGAYGVTLHDNDLVPADSSASDREVILKKFRTALDATGLKVPMTTVNLFTRPIFKEGALTANDPDVRRFALAKALDAIDLGAELGANIFVLWGGREGTESHAAKPVAEALDRYAEAINTMTSYISERSYNVRIAIEPKPNEPRGDILLPTVGHALAFIESLDAPDMVGVNPEFAHETMSGLSFHHGVAQALWAGKLFHIDLNAQRIGRFDQDFRFGSEEVKEAFYLVQLLESSGYDGMRHFDAHPYRTEGPEGVWDFARGCIRTYLILKEKAQAFRRRPGDPGGARRRARSGPRDADECRRRLGAGAAQLREDPRRRGARPRPLRPRATRPIGDRVATRRPITTR